MCEEHWRIISLCAGNSWWREDSSLENQDCRESHTYVNPCGDGEQVWSLSKFGQ